MASERRILQFVSFQSTLDAGFWHELGRRKLEMYQLSEKPVDIRGYYTNSTVPGLPTSLALDYSAFEASVSASVLSCTCPGELRNTNTLDAFKTSDKKQLLEGAGKKVWDSIISGAAIRDPCLLNNFLLLSYSDLKKYNFYYWFAFPALLPDEPATVATISPAGKSFTSDELGDLAKAYDTFIGGNPSQCFFLVNRNERGFTLHPLSAFSTVHKMGVRLMVGFCDPSTVEENPGWPLRNFLLLLGQTWAGDVSEVDVLCYRDYTRDGKRHVEHSLVLGGVTLPKKFDNVGSVPKVVGWEKNEKGKTSPRLVNLSANMDPVRLSESAVDLNLKLMRWRLMPSLDLEVIRSTKCLLLGAGTLGCNVARCLLGWGIRHITLVDNSTVSYSNPVRQSLFQFTDCLNGGAKKASAAAAALRAVFPGVTAEGLELSIPMPGHSVGSEPGAVEKVKEDVRRLEELMLAHDAVFLLMDTRESRWLPTLLSTHYSKLCINAALGFDTFMVMRHGYLPACLQQEELHSISLSEQKIVGSELGCYFCNDVVAPTNSTRDRTLDQQCTVSRPGLSMIAAALVVELLVSVLQHPEQGLASASCQQDAEDMESESPLGLVPHQIRGFLSRFQNILPASQRFDKCTACSNIVRTSFRRDGFDFLLQAFNSPNFLEDLTGLSQLYAETLNDHVWELSDDEDF